MGGTADGAGIAAIEDEVAELVRIIAQSHRGDIPRESAAFAEFRRTCLAVMIRLQEVLPDEYDLLEQTERAEIRFFWMLRRHRLTVIFLAKLETHFPIAVHCLHTPLLYVRRSLAGLRERRPPRPRPPLRRPLPRGPDGDALGRGMIRRFVSCAPGCRPVDSDSSAAHLALLLL